MVLGKEMLVVASDRDGGVVGFGRCPTHVVRSEPMLQKAPLATDSTVPRTGLYHVSTDTGSRTPPARSSRASRALQAR